MHSSKILVGEQCNSPTSFFEECTAWKLVGELLSDEYLRGMHI